VNRTKRCGPIAISALFVFSASSETSAQPGEQVDPKSLSGSAQQTITERAAGGESLKLNVETTPTANGITSSSPDQWKGMGLRSRSEREIRKAAHRDQQIIVGWKA
jgi:hypothetical protein